MGGFGLQSPSDDDTIVALRAAVTNRWFVAAILGLTRGRIWYRQVLLLVSN